MNFFAKNLVTVYTSCAWVLLLRASTGQIKVPVFPPIIFWLAFQRFQINKMIDSFS